MAVPAPPEADATYGGQNPILELVSSVRQWPCAGFLPAIMTERGMMTLSVEYSSIRLARQFAWR